MENKNPDGNARDTNPPGRGAQIECDVSTAGGDFIGRDKIIQIGTLKIPRAISPLLISGLAIGIAGIAFIAVNLFAITGVVTAPIPTSSHCG